MQLFMCIVTFMASVMAQDACNAGFWGDDCNFLCGQCKGNNSCSKENGKCLTENGCETGWTDVDCMKPLCYFGTSADQCGNGNLCVSPDSCVCTGLTTRDENGKCYSLRVAGLKGAGISIIVLIVSIFACQGGYKFVHSQN